VRGAAQVSAMSATSAARMYCLIVFGIKASFINEQLPMNNGGYAWNNTPRLQTSLLIAHFSLVIAHC
jgi:hypothetical protein